MQARDIEGLFGHCQLALQCGRCGHTFLVMGIVDVVERIVEDGGPALLEVIGAETGREVLLHRCADA